MFIWNDVYRVSYGSAVVYAVAETEEEARRLAESAPVSQYGSDPGNTERPQRGCGLKGRAPDRVLDVPCAEIYEWSE